MLGYVLQQDESDIGGHTAAAEHALKILGAHDTRLYSLPTNPAQEKITCKFNRCPHIKSNASWYAKDGNEAGLSDTYLAFRL